VIDEGGFEMVAIEADASDSEPQPS